MEMHALRRLADDAWNNGEFDTALDTYEVLAKYNTSFQLLLLKRAEALLKVAEILKTIGELRKRRHSRLYPMPPTLKSDEKLQTLVEQSENAQLDIIKHLTQEVYKTLEWRSGDNTLLHPPVGLNLKEIRSAAAKFAKAAAQHGLKAS